MRLNKNNRRYRQRNRSQLGNYLLGAMLGFVLVALLLLLLFFLLVAFGTNAYP